MKTYYKMSREESPITEWTREEIIKFEGKDAYVMSIDKETALLVQRKNRRCINVLEISLPRIPFSKGYKTHSHHKDRSQEYNFLGNQLKPNNRK